MFCTTTITVSGAIEGAAAAAAAPAAAPPCCCSHWRTRWAGASAASAAVAACGCSSGWTGTDRDVDGEMGSGESRASSEQKW